MKTIVETHNGFTLVISAEEYLGFKVGDKYYTTMTSEGCKSIRTQREADLANRIIPSKYYLESAGGKHLVIHGPDRN